MPGDPVVRLSRCRLCGIGVQAANIYACTAPRLRHVWQLFARKQCRR